MRVGNGIAVGAHIFAHLVLGICLRARKYPFQFCVHLRKFTFCVLSNELQFRKRIEYRHRWLSDSRQVLCDVVDVSYKLPRNFYRRAPQFDHVFVVEHT